MIKNQIISDGENMKATNEEFYNNRMSLLELMRNSPIPDEELINHIALFLDRRVLSRFFFIQEMYEKFLDIHGSIFEFGVRYGQNLSLFTSMRGIYEPFNYNRKIVGFDTFEGFPEMDSKDDNTRWKKGDYSVPENYEAYLDVVLKKHESMAPIEGIKKFELVKGDATKTVKEYLKNHQETIIAFAYFDFDIYAPTKECLEAIVPHLSKGAVLGFDEINDPLWPGETAALREVLGTNNFKIIHSKFRANAGYLIYG